MVIVAFWDNIDSFGVRVTLDYSDRALYIYSFMSNTSKVLS